MDHACKRSAERIRLLVGALLLLPSAGSCVVNPAHSQVDGGEDAGAEPNGPASAIDGALSAPDAPADAGATETAALRDLPADLAPVDVRGTETGSARGGAGGLGGGTGGNGGDGTAGTGGATGTGGAMVGAGGAMATGGAGGPSDAGADRGPVDVAPVAFTVTFDSQGGSPVPSQRVLSGDHAIAPPDPTWTGHAFQGWYQDLAGTLPWAFGVDRVAAEVTLYARWTTNRYTVAFDAQGGSAVASQTIAYGGYVTPPVSPTRSGYRFAAWCKEAACTHTWSFASDTVTGDLTLYAGWGVAPPDIGTQPANQRVDKGQPATFTVAASGLALRYQWQKDGVDIPDATLSWYTIPSTTVEQSGTSYRCVVINDAGSVPSLSALLIVNSHRVGEVFGGGVVFWVDGTGQHGLIAAASDQGGGVPWGCYGTSMSTSTELGSGRENTGKIATECADSVTAARVCMDLELEGFEDWYLPAIAELDLLWEVRTLVGGFGQDATDPAANMYWSSSEEGANFAWIRNSYSSQNDGDAFNKTGLYRVRPVRSY